MTTSRALIISCVIVFGIIGVLAFGIGNPAQPVGSVNVETQHYPLYPDRSKTPGAKDRPLTKEYLCTHSTKERRNVSTAMKRKVFELYGLKYPPPRGAYEVDHFISLCIGGKNDVENLFPQPRDADPNDGIQLGFPEKDRLEAYLCRAMCKGEMSLDEARKIIWTNWIQGYDEYIGNRTKKFGRGVEVGGEEEEFEECEEGCP